MRMLPNGLQVDNSVHKWHLALVCSRVSFSWILKYEHMTIIIRVLKYIFPLQTRTQNYHPQVSQCATLNVITKINFHFKKITFVSK